jgi:hypothetical protein
MTTSISYSLIIGLINVLTQTAREQQSGPVQLPAATIAAYPRGGISSRYFASIRMQAKRRAVGALVAKKTAAEAEELAFSMRPNNDFPRSVSFGRDTGRGAEVSRQPWRVEL